MVLALVDDLMFSSKIRAAAKQLDVPLTFARSREAALTELQREKPAVVILDLNGTRMDPLGTIAAMKADASLAGIPTVGFVSHVHTDLIDAARRAGVDDVLPRSAFVVQLADILMKGR
jgi:PleD family two-component response regulator